MKYKITLSKSIWFLTCFFIHILMTPAQTKAISGVITDKTNNQPLNGVSIFIAGTAVGVVSDFDGNYSINASVGDVLTVSSLGMKPVTITVGNQDVINIELEPDIGELEETIVIGYGTVTKADFTGSSSQVEADDIYRAPVVNLEQALQGRAAGVKISSLEHSPGAELDILIRGGTSLGGNNAPLYVIDGFPTDTDVGSTINVQDIESINILKDASATSIYGARGSNGVILITTKSGEEGKVSVNYNYQYGVQRVVDRYPEVLTPVEFAKFQNEFRPESETYADPLSFADVEPANWSEKIFQTAPYSNHDLSISGGAANTKYRASLSFVNQDGVVLNSNYERATGRMNLRQQVGKKFEIALNASYSHKTTLGAPNTGHKLFIRSLEAIPYVTDAYDIDEGLYVDLERIPRLNPVADIRSTTVIKRDENLTVNAIAKYELIKGLHFEFKLGHVGRNSKQKSSALPPSSKGRSSNGRAFIVHSLRQQWINENLIRFKPKLHKNHKLESVFAFTQESFWAENVRVVNSNFPILNEFIVDNIQQGTNLDLPSSSLSERSLRSYLGRVDYDFKRKYYLTLTFRLDQASQFSKGNKSALFQSAALSWRVIQEPFMKKIPAISNLKFKVSIGDTGNTRIGPYASLARLATTNYSVDNSVSLGVSPSSLENENLKWESNRQLNIGAELGFFRNRVQIDANYYYRKTTDLLLSANIPSTSGFGTSLLNVGSLDNEGFELFITSENINTGHFSWSTELNIAFNRNKVLELTQGQDSFLIERNYNASSRNREAYIIKRGSPVGSMFGYVWDGIYNYDSFHVSGEGANRVYTLKETVPAGINQIIPGDIKYKDLNGDGVISREDRTIIGNANPVHFGGIMNRFRYKSLILSAFFEWTYGNDVLNATRYELESLNGRDNQFASVKNRFRPEVYDESGTLIDAGFSDTTLFATNGNRNRFYSDRVIEDGSYLRLKTVTLSYELPRKMLRPINLKYVNVFLSAQNLLTFTNYSGTDPDVHADATFDNTRSLVRGVDFGGYPTATTISMGLNINI